MSYNKLKHAICTLRYPKAQNYTHNLLYISTAVKQQLIERSLQLPKNLLSRVSTSFAVTLTKITNDNFLTTTD